jgi:hypothetical protein
MTSGFLGEGVVHIMGCSGDRMKRSFHRLDIIINDPCEIFGVLMIHENV